MLQVNFKTVVIMQSPVNGDFEQNFVTLFRKSITLNSTCLGQGYRNRYNLIKICIKTQLKNCEVNNLGTSKSFFNSSIKLSSWTAVSSGTFL